MPISKADAYVRVQELATDIRQGKFDTVGEFDAPEFWDAFDELRDELEALIS